MHTINEIYIYIGIVIRHVKRVNTICFVLNNSCMRIYTKEKRVLAF